MMTWTLGHTSPSEAFRECARIIRPAGWLYLYDVFAADATHELEGMEYVVWPLPEIVEIAGGCGWELEKVLHPKRTYSAHMLTVISRAKVEQSFGDTEPELLRFRVLSSAARFRPSRSPTCPRQRS